MYVCMYVCVINYDIYVIIYHHIKLVYVMLHIS